MYKAMLFGPIRFRFHASDHANDADSGWVDCDYGSTLSGVSIDSRWASAAPNTLNIDLLHPDIRYVIIVEKEAIFHRLVEDGFTK